MIKKIKIRRDNECEIIVYLDNKSLNELKKIIDGDMHLSDIDFPDRAIYSELIEAYKNGQIDFYS